MLGLTSAESLPEVAARSRFILVAALLLWAMPVAAFSAPTDPQVESVETLIRFDPSRVETPEGVVVDRAGRVWFTLALTGEVRRLEADGTQTTLAQLPIGPGPICGNGTPAIIGTLTLDAQENAYVTVNSCTPANRGVWRVSPDGAAEQIAVFPPLALINGIEIVGSRIYVADSLLGVIWTLPIEGGVPQVWSDHPLLANDPNVMAPGPNGIQFFSGEFYVANSSTRQVIAISIAGDERPGAVRVHADLPFGGDDFAIDARGNLWMTTDPANRLLLVRPDGSSVTVLDAEDGLDGPTDAAFGRMGPERFELYLTNAAFPFFTTTFRPTLMRLEVTVPGAPD